jgi:hypothetical protein
MTIFYVAKNVYNEISMVVENKKGKISQHVPCTLWQTIYYSDFKQLIPEQLAID